MANPKVAVLKTRPETVLEDYQRLLHLAEYKRFLPKENDTALKINVSWQKYFPACSTAPWQLEGVIRALRKDGYSRDLMYACHNRTVVVSAKKGEVNNKQLPVVKKYGLRNIHLYEREKWVRYKPKGDVLVLNRIFPKGLKIPQRFIGENIIHLPTMKTHVFTTLTGAMKNAFGGLLNEKRHWAHSVIHETLVDLLMIQKEIHGGIFAVMDGTIAGDGPGPRCMVPVEKNYILAGGDPVAVDAIAAKMMGFDPLSLEFIRLAHERGLGVGDPAKIVIAGDDISHVNFHFSGNQNTLASLGQKMIYHGWLKPFEKLLLQTCLAPWSYAASRLYHDVYWYLFIGKKRIMDMEDTPWGRLFAKY
ncbi:MAG: DUF362 domain-containing protein [Thermodesulfobacteriota bacterium]|nr:DUF362 domain-containing protein [Thermodesulfobacteriota bacterium]